MNFNIFEKFKSLKKPNSTEILESYHRFLVSRQYADTTVKMYLLRVSQFLSKYPNPVMVTEAQIESYLSKIMEEGMQSIRIRPSSIFWVLRLPKYPFLISGLREGQSGMGWDNLKLERYSWLKLNPTSLNCCHQRQERGKRL